MNIVQTAGGRRESARSRSARMTTPTRSPAPKRRGPPPTPAPRQRLERSADLYLRDCYVRRTAARSDEYARYLELTRQYVARKALAALGVPLRDFLRARQLRYAEHLLRATSYSTVEIAAMSAFGTHPTFYRAFKAAYGMTPGEYRNRIPK
jgi:AraC-like DNA-binding protein